MDDLGTCLEQVIRIAKRAGQIILDYRLQAADFQLSYKKDKTLLTAADLAANDCITTELQAAFPAVPLLSEEGDIEDYTVRQQWSRYWLVDPLDGTRGFVEGSTEFTVNIALVQQNVVVLGVIYAPALSVCYYAAEKVGVFKQVDGDVALPLVTRPLDWSDYRLTLGRRLANQSALAIYQRDPCCRLLQRHSSLKLCLLAEGSVDIYPNFGRTSEWDTAAGQCILEQAGGAVLDQSGDLLRYNHKASLLNPAFVAVGDATQAKQVVQFISDKRKN